MISANIKADVKQQEITELVAVSKYRYSLSCNVLWEVPSKLEMQCKIDVFFI